MTRVKGYYTINRYVSVSRSPTYSEGSVGESNEVSKVFRSSEGLVRAR